MRSESTEGEALVVVAEVRDEGLKRAVLEEVAVAISSGISVEHGIACRDVVLIEPRAIAKTTSGKIQRGAFKKEYTEGAHARATAALEHGPQAGSSGRGEGPSEDAAAAERPACFTICWAAMSTAGDDACTLRTPARCCCTLVVRSDGVGGVQSAGGRLPDLAMGPAGVVLLLEGGDGIAPRLSSLAASVDLVQRLPAHPLRSLRLPVGALQRYRPGMG